MKLLHIMSMTLLASLMIFDVQTARDNESRNVPYESRKVSGFPSSSPEMEEALKENSFKDLPDSVKKSGKSVKLLLSSSSKRDIVVNISQSVKATGKPAVSQKVPFTSSEESITVNIAQPMDNQTKIRFNIMPARLWELTKPRYNVSKRLKRDYNPHTELRTPGYIRLMQALTTDVTYDFNNMPDEIVLSNPMEILTDILGCPC